jgi:6-pyruvoyltetrahydropterin/6-carboxytetrahydropterin synthase
MFTITKEFCFEAAHCLPHLPLGHKCREPHGHSYRVQMVLEANGLSDDGFVRDYANLDRVKQFLDREWDHHDLNMMAPRGLGPVQTTAEMLAWWLYRRFKPTVLELTEVRVSETGKTWASYHVPLPTALPPARPEGDV